MFNDRRCLVCTRIGIERVSYPSVRPQYDNTEERNAERRYDLAQS
jgi:hypothetical protein